ncbi:MAG: DNA translocase FtsK 4TM domain-containing protein, partial [Planctomycetia bacterium]|nr:DNA translocase FtsK 4TM domain-containing protein [Planctomycetia bacterium]
MQFRQFFKIREIVIKTLVCALFLFVSLSLLSFTPSDPGGGAYWPLTNSAANLCGELGATFANNVFAFLGYGAWFLLLVSAYHTARTLAGIHARHVYWRFSGYCVAQIGFCASASIFFQSVFYPSGYSSSFSVPYTFGHGGLMGSTFASVVEPAGEYVALPIALLGLSVGLILYSDYFVPLAWQTFLNLLPEKIGRPLLKVSAPLFDERAGWASSSDSEDTNLSGAAPVVAEPLDDRSHARIHESPHGAPALDAGLWDLNPSEIGDSLAQDAAFDEAEADDDFAAEDADAEALDAETLNAQREKTGFSIHHPISSPIVVSDAGNAADAPAVEEAPPEEEKEYVYPSVSLLEKSPEFDYSEFEKDAAERAKFLEEIVAEFGFRIRVREIQLGPVITQYQVELEAGMRVAKIANLADDLAVKLGVANVRIVFPLLGKKNLVGIEIPNVKKQLVRLREVMEELAGTYEKMSIPVFLGRDVAGKPLMTDLASLPHLLIAGRTGTGKSVCLNSIITSIIMSRSPKEVRMLMIDPKMVELSQYKMIPHLMHPVVTDMKKAEAILAWAVEKMEDRYRWLARVGVRHVNSYNKMSYEEKLRRAQAVPGEAVPKNMPFIVIIADEMADLMMTAPKEVESHIIRLAQKSRAVGIHLILATQKPIVSVITSLIKSNLPARIAFQVSSRTDSRVVLDENGADRLLGHGDMLFLLPGTSTLVRAQGTYLSDDEINRVVSQIATGEPQFEGEIDKHLAGPGSGGLEELAQRDEMYIPAIDIIVREKRGSITLLQRMLGIGYGRAARLIDYMEEDGIVGPFCGNTKPREVLMSVEQWEALNAQSSVASAGTSGEFESVSRKNVWTPPEELAEPVAELDSELDDANDENAND